MKKITIIGIIGIMVLTSLYLVSGGVTNNGDGTITLSYTLTTSEANELQNAICYNYNYQTQIEDDVNGGFITNPESCQEFAQRKIKEFFKQHVKAYRYKLAEENINTGNDISIS